MSIDTLKKHIKENGEFLSLIFNSSNDIVYFVDKEKKVICSYGSTVNREPVADEKLFENQAHERYLSRALNGESLLYEWRDASRENARVFQVSLSPIAAKDGSIAGVLAIERDVTINEIVGTSSRCNFDKKFNEEWARASRYSNKLALIACEVDYFSAFECIYSSAQISSCINNIAKVIKSSMQRAGDEAAYYGKGVFLIMLPNTDAEGASFVAENIISRVENLSMLNETSPLNQITISAGVVSIVPGMTNLLPFEDFLSESLIKLAFETLSEAKSHGPNTLRVCE